MASPEHIQLQQRISYAYCGLTAVYILFLGTIVTFADRKVFTGVFLPSTWVRHGDKIGHLILMGLFSFLLNSAVYCRRVSLAGIRVRLGSFLAFSIVFAEEFSQIWIASRNFDFVDLFFDLVGIGLFGWLASVNHAARERCQPLPSRETIAAP